MKFKFSTSMKYFRRKVENVGELCMYFVRDSLGLATSIHVFEERIRAIPKKIKYVLRKLSVSYVENLKNSYLGVLPETMLSDRICSLKRTSCQ